MGGGCGEGNGNGNGALGRRREWMDKGREFMMGEEE